jgi:hypothetical protein
MSRYWQVDLNAKYHEVTIVVKLLINNVTYHTPQNRANDTITNVTLNNWCPMFMVFSAMYTTCEGPILDA